MAIDEYNRRVIAALRQAQAMSGARSANAYARLLAERGHGSPSASTYRRWISGEAVVPAWALQVAADVADTNVQALLDGQTDTRLATDDWRLRIEDAIGRLESELIEVRQHVGLPWQTEDAPTASQASAPDQQRAAT